MMLYGHSMAYALNDSLIDLNMNLNEFKLGSSILAENIKNCMLNLKFHGITGNIKFDNNTGLNSEVVATGHFTVW